MSYSDGKGSPPLVNIYAYITNNTELQYAYITEYHNVNVHAYIALNYMYMYVYTGVH